MFRAAVSTKIDGGNSGCNWCRDGVVREHGSYHVGGGGLWRMRRAERIEGGHLVGDAYGQKQGATFLTLTLRLL